MYEGQPTHLYDLLINLHKAYQEFCRRVIAEQNAANNRHYLRLTTDPLIK